MDTQQPWAPPLPGAVCLFCRQDRRTTVPMTVLSPVNWPTTELISMWRRITGKVFPDLASIAGAMCYECLAEMRRTVASIEKFTRLASMLDANLCGSRAKLDGDQSGSAKTKKEAADISNNVDTSCSARRRDEHRLSANRTNVSPVPPMPEDVSVIPQTTEPATVADETTIEWLDFSASEPDDESDCWPAECSDGEETTTASESQREQRKVDPHDPPAPFVCHLCGEQLCGQLQWRNHLQRAHDSVTGYMNRPPIEYQFTQGTTKRRLIYTPREQQLFKCIQSMNHYCRYKCLSDGCDVTVLLLHNGELRGLSGEHSGHGTQEELFESFKEAQKRRDARRSKLNRRKAQPATKSQRAPTSASIEHILTPSRLIYTCGERQLYRPTVTMPDHVRYCCVVFQCRSTLRLMTGGELVQSRRIRHSHRYTLEAIYERVRDVRSKLILQLVAKALDEQQRRAKEAFQAERESGRRDRKAVVILRRRTRGQKQSKTKT